MAGLAEELWHGTVCGGCCSLSTSIQHGLDQRRRNAEIAGMQCREHISGRIDQAALAGQADHGGGAGHSEADLRATARPARSSISSSASSPQLMARRRLAASSSSRSGSAGSLLSTTTACNEHEGQILLTGQLDPAGGDCASAVRVQQKQRHYPRVKACLPARIFGLSRDHDRREQSSTSTRSSRKYT
jgi:hypothetical protein